MQTDFQKAIVSLEQAAKSMARIDANAGVVRADLTETHRLILVAIDDEAKASKQNIHNLEQIAAQMLKLADAIEGKDDEKQPAETPNIALAAE